MDNIPDLEKMCASCKGTGWCESIKEDDGGWGTCSDCAGTGFIPTEIGARILELVRHNSRVNITAEFRVSERVAS